MGVKRKIKDGKIKVNKIQKIKKSTRTGRIITKYKLKDLKQ